MNDKLEYEQNIKKAISNDKWIKENFGNKYKIDDYKLTLLDIEYHNYDWATKNRKWKYVQGYQLLCILIKIHGKKQNDLIKLYKEWLIYNKYYWVSTKGAE